MTTNSYLIKEGYNNLNKHGSKTISTMLIICATMLILGIFIIILQNVNQNVETLRLEQGLQAFIEDNATDEDVAYMEDEIKQIPGVSEIEYMDKDAAYEDAKNQFKDQEYFLEGLEDLDIFPASFIVKFTNIEEAEQIKAEVEKIEGIYNVKYNADTIDAVISISHVANIFLLGVGTVLLVVSIFIISNTIKEKIMLRLDKITKDYISGDSKVEALKGISIEFRKNEFVSILGQSGCGKTTLLNIIGGLDR